MYRLCILFNIYIHTYIYIYIYTCVVIICFIVIIAGARTPCSSTLLKSLVEKFHRVV